MYGRGHLRHMALRVFHWLNPLKDPAVTGQNMLRCHWFILQTPTVLKTAFYFRKHELQRKASVFALATFLFKEVNQVTTSNSGATLCVC